MTYTPVGTPEDVVYRLRALDKLRWPALYLFAAFALTFTTFISVTRSLAK